MATAVLCLLVLQSHRRDGDSASATKLPSPILAAALLPLAGGGQDFDVGFGRGNLSSRPLIPILTVDGMVHV